MTDRIRNIIEAVIDVDELELAIFEAVQNRIDYDEIADRIAENISQEEIDEIALDIYLNS